MSDAPVYDAAAEQWPFGAPLPLLGWTVPAKR
jgi:hypothetical protein